MSSVFIDCGESYGIETPNRVFSTLEAAKAYGGDWIKEYPIDVDSPAIRQWSRCSWQNNNEWQEYSLVGGVVV